MGGRPAEAGDVLFRHHRVAELVVFVIVLDDRARQGGTFLHAEALRERAGNDVPDHNLDWNYLNLSNELLAHVKATHEVSRNADVGELRHQELADAVVDHALAGDRAALLRVEGGGVVLEVLHERARLGALEHHLGLAFIDLLASRHWAGAPDLAGSRNVYSKWGV